MSDQLEKVSLSSIWGNFENEDESVEVSFRKGILTIVKRMKNELKVSRVPLSAHSRTVSEGECVENGEFSQEEVYKKCITRGGPGENEIEVEEFAIEKPWLRPAHGNKFIGAMTYRFITQEGIEMMKVKVTHSK